MTGYSIIILREHIPFLILLLIYDFTFFKTVYTDFSQRFFDTLYAAI